MTDVTVIVLGSLAALCFLRAAWLLIAIACERDAIRRRKHRV